METEASVKNTEIVVRRKILHRNKTLQTDIPEAVVQNVRSISLHNNYASVHIIWIVMKAFLFKLRSTTARFHTESTYWVAPNSHKYNFLQN